MGEGIVIFYDPGRFDAAIKMLCSRWRMPLPSEDWHSRHPAAMLPSRTFIMRYIETDVPYECEPDCRDWLYYSLIDRDKMTYPQFCRRSEKTLQKAEVLRVEVWT